MIPPNDDNELIPPAEYSEERSDLAVFRAELRAMEKGLIGKSNTMHKWVRFGHWVHTAMMRTGIFNGTQFSKDSGIHYNNVQRATVVYKVKENNTYFYSCRSACCSPTCTMH